VKIASAAGHSAAVSGFANFANPKDVNNPPNVKASDTKKNHIMIFPYPILNGDTLPPHSVAESICLEAGVLII
jgi:hypothetical protein